MVVEKKLVTADEYEDFIALPENRNRRFELFNGEIIEMSPTMEHGISGSIINGELYSWNKVNPIGRVMTETSYQMPDDEHNAPIPDVSFIVGLDTPIVRKGNVPRMPDLAVEVKSPTNTYLEQREKAAYYIANGCRLVWLVFPAKRLIEVYRPNMDVEILTDEDTLDGYDVLPGFRLAVRDVFVPR
ncbi:MAG: Uma2 family endonuclease [Burkholderiales bacterium]|nr:Uma2 family endonuclease [Anaerolineae bacterium]